MPRFAWNADLETGHDHIDRQHRSLFELARKLDECASCANDEGELVSDAIYALNDYVIEHFADEEALMRDSSYPRASNHRGLHEQLTAHTMRLMTDYFNGEHVAAARIGPFVTDWLRGHIEKEDRALVDFLAGHPRQEE